MRSIGTVRRCTNLSTFPSETLAVHTRLNRTPRFWPSAKQYLFDAIGLAISTLVGFRLGADVETAFSVYLIILAVQSLRGSCIGSIALSIFAVGCLTYFFVPPLFAFSHKLYADLQAISAFLTTSIIITGL